MNVTILAATHTAACESVSLCCLTEVMMVVLEVAYTWLLYTVHCVHYCTPLQYTLASNITIQNVNKKFGVWISNAGELNFMQSLINTSYVFKPMTVA